ncbi:hypothetical protein HII31_07568 [Pseudocercospora fuligena]|uniref:Uncharacterized protein n=1 Tax=Pseudocercospora fuligena TaxID=685502 RepID=A0A8H6VG38_9PEZI|nr:hypothetical protein HII31_07568 [Pseudocercospora fuligena]
MTQQAPTLQVRLESLPRELYDIIFDYTSTPTSRNGVVTVDAKFNGAAVSNVSRATNALLLERYNTCTVVGSIFQILHHLESFRGRGKLQNEIYDEIYTLTFTPDVSTFTIYGDFKTPKMSQIDAASAALYFSKCTFVGYLQSMVEWLQDIEHTPPVSSRNIRCYIIEDAEGWPSNETEQGKAIWMTVEVDRVEEDFGEDCCLDLPMYWTREEAMQGLQLS